MDELFPLEGYVDPANEPLRQAILNELFVLFPDDGLFSLRTTEEKLVRLRAEFVEFIVLDIVNTRLLKILQRAVRRDRNELIPASHREFVQG